MYTARRKYFVAHKKANEFVQLGLELAWFFNAITTNFYMISELKAQVRGVTCLAALALGSLAFNAHSAVVHLIDTDGKLTGATGVVVQGITYSVSFMDGACASLFTGCDSQSDFFFQTLDSALAAAESLKSAVFVDLGQGRNFSSVPSLTKGCSDTFCGVAIPYGVVIYGGVFGPFAQTVTVQNFGPNALGNLFVGGNLSPALDSTDYPTFTFAVWSMDRANEVPEPTSLALIGLGLASLGASRRIKKP